MSTDLPLFESDDPPETLAQRFATSFSDFAVRNQYTAILRPTEQEIRLTASAACDGKPFDADACEFFQVAGRALVKQAAVSSIRSILCGVAASSDSILEAVICLAIGIAARAKDCAVLYDFGRGVAFGDADGDLVVRIQPQMQIGRYRVDALVSMLLVEEQNGRIQSFGSRVVVECDGYEFHEKTREQAEHDRVRDRFLQSLGLRVFHFLGSEIWRDPFRCAEDIITLLDGSVREQAALPRKCPQSVRKGAAGMQERECAH